MLYPVLQKEAERDNNLNHILEIFAEDMSHITKEVENFFNKYEDKNFGDDFYSDLGKLCAEISQRIIHEEEIIYKIYEELINKKK
jgi:hypothetical protein